MFDVLKRRQCGRVVVRAAELKSRGHGFKSCSDHFNSKHLMTGPEGNSEYCFSRISMFPSTSSRETLRFEGNKLHCSLRDPSLSDLLYSKTKQKQNLKTAPKFQRSRATAVNISWVTVNCFLFDVIVFAVLPAHGIWQETVILLDVM